MSVDRPKILFVFHGSDMESGGTRSLMDIIFNLYESDKYDFEAVFPYRKGSASAWFEDHGFPVYICHYGLLMQDLTQSPVKRIAKYPLFLARHMRSTIEANRLAKVLKSHRFDIVYSNTSSIVFGGMLGKRLGAKQIWHIREFRVLDHGITYYLGERRLKRFIQEYSDEVLTVSQAVKDYHSDVISPDKIHVTYNSYSADFIHPKRAFNFNKSLNLLLAGDVKPGKGQLEAIEALGIARSKGLDRNFKLHFAGVEVKPDYSQKLRKRISQLGLEDSVIFHGFVKDMVLLKDDMDVGLVSSSNEAFGRTMIEGMLCQLAMIGRDSGGTSEQISDGETGLLYNGTVDDLAAKYLALDGDRSLLQQLALAGFEYAKQFTNGRAAEVTERAINSVISYG